LQAKGGQGVVNLALSFILVSLGVELVAGPQASQLP